MELELREHVIPNDKLQELHTLDEECFCYPVTWKSQVLHRPFYMISINGEYITGYVAVIGAKR